MQEPKLFQSLSKEEKANFFVKCQEILINHHPESEFIFRQDNVKDRMEFARSFLNKYKGFAYSNNEICLLFNKVVVKDPKNPVKVIKDHVYQPPQANFNAFSIDFVVFRKLVDCLSFCKFYYTPQIEYLLFVRHNDVKLYKADQLIQKMANVPLAAWL